MIAAACANGPHISRNFLSNKPGSLTNCAEFPHACIVKAVPTDSSSPPIESVLFSHSHAPLTLFWQAPPALTSVNVIIALPFVSTVSELALLVDAKGYNASDAPILSVCVGHTLESVERFLASSKKSKVSSSPTQHSDDDKAYGVGEWAVDMEGYPTKLFVHVLVSSTFTRYTPCSTLIFTFPEPRECQIVAIKFSLPADNTHAFSQTPPSPKVSTSSPSPTHSPTLNSDSTHKSLKLTAPVPPHEHISPPPQYLLEPNLPEQQPIHSHHAHHLHAHHSHHSHHSLHSHHPPHHPHHSHSHQQQTHADVYPAPQLHIGRIRIHGTFSASNPLSFPLSIFNPTSAPPPQVQPQQTHRSPQSLPRSNSLRSGLNSPPPSYQPPDGWKPVSPVSDLYPSARGKSLEITVSTAPGSTGLRLMGFGLTVQHTGDGVVSQVRELRVTGLSTNTRSEICAFHNLCRILVPKTCPNTTLYFDIPSPPLNVVMFEFLSSYGSPDAAPCTINLFS